MHVNFDLKTKVIYNLKRFILLRHTCDSPHTSIKTSNHAIKQYKRLQLNLIKKDSTKIQHKKNVSFSSCNCSRNYNITICVSFVLDAVIFSCNC